MLFKIINIDKHSDQWLTAEVGLNPEDEIILGHFPGNPVLPGASMIQIMRTVLQQGLNLKLVLNSAANIKFISSILPLVNKSLKFDIQTLRTGASLSVETVLSVDNVKCMKFSGIYQIVLKQ